MSKTPNLPIVEFKVVLRADDLLSIGWGYPGPTGTDTQLFRFKPSVEAEPVIPGSTIKGSLRTAVIRVARILGLNVCNEVDPELIKLYCRPDDVLLKMFGKPGDSSPSRLIVEPFTVKGKAITTVLKHVSIERDSLKARKGALYSSEYIVPCTLFEGKMILDLRGLDVDEASRMLELLLLALLELEDIGIGRGSRRVSVLRIELSRDIIKALEDNNVLTPLSKKILDILTSNRNKPCIR